MITQYAIVQHSAAGYKDDRTFAHGLESRRITTAKEVRAVHRVGGRVFDSYGTAEDYCEREQYPTDGMGLVPQAPGTFADLEIDGLKVYIPKEKP